MPVEKRSKYQGFLVVEAVVALGIFLSLFLVIMGAGSSGYSTAVKADLKANAYDLTATALGSVQGDLSNWIPSRTETSSFTINNREFQVTQEAKTLADGSIEVEVTATWDELGQAKSVSQGCILLTTENP